MKKLILVVSLASTTAWTLEMSQSLGAIKPSSKPATAEVVQTRSPLYSVPAEPAQQRSETVPRTLQEAIFTALQVNKIAVAADERVEALRLTAIATRAERLPDLNGFCGIAKTDTITDPTVGKNTRSKIQGTTCGVSLSGSLYDGGANRYRHQAAKANAASVDASLNTSDSQLNNTRGGLANDIMDSYSQLSQGRARMRFFKYKRELLETISKLGESDKLTDVKQSTNQNMSQIKNNLEIFELRYSHLVKSEAPSNLESLDATIAQLKIPTSFADAFASALENSPEIKRRVFGLQQAEFSLKAIKAAMGPSLSFKAEMTNNHRHNGMNSLNTSDIFSKSVGVTLIIPIGNLSKKYATQSSQATVRSRQAEHEVAIEKVEYELKASYIKLAHEQANYVTANEKYLLIKGEMDEIAERIKSGNVDGLELSKVLDKLQEMQKQFVDALTAQNVIYDRLLSIYQVTGLLFTQYVFLPSNN